MSFIEHSGLGLQHKSSSLPNIGEPVSKTSSAAQHVKNPSCALDVPSFGFERIREKGENKPAHQTNTLGVAVTQKLNKVSPVSSTEHSNASVIEMYRDAGSFVSSEEIQVLIDQRPDKILPKPQSSGINNGDRSSAYESGSIISSPELHSSMTVENLSSIQHSRKSASKIRLSIEESRTEIKSDRDRYGFKKKTNFVNETQYNNWWLEYSKHCSRRKKKWELLLQKNGLTFSNDNPIRFPPKSEKLKRYIRKGVPAEWRGNAWWYFAKGPEKLKNNVGIYDSLIESTINLQNKDTEIIERDLNRTFPDNLYFRQDHIPRDISASDLPETPLIQALRRVLVAFSTYQPNIGYCQSLNFIAGLLLIFMDEERAFWMLVIITSRYLPGVHEINLEGVNVDQGVLMLAIKEFLPDTWEKIMSINFDNTLNSTENYDFLKKLPPITLCTSSWFMSIFIGILPIETTLRVWDCFFYEESNFLFKISLSIFKIIEPKIMNLQDEMDIFQLVQNIPKGIFDPTILFDVLFKKKHGFNNLTQEEINRCRKFVTLQRRKSQDHSDVNFNRKLLDESLWQPDFYGRKGLPGVHWNKNLTRKMKQIRKRK